jgi:hypothetical protein
MIMKKVLNILICLVSIASYGQEYIWESTDFAQTNNSWSKKYQFELTQFDEKYLVGYFRDSLNIANQSLYSSKNYGVFLVKYSAEDELLFAKTIAERMYSGSSTPNIEIDSQENVYVGLNYNDTLFIGEQAFPVSEDCLNCSDFAVLKFDGNGNQLLHLRLDDNCTNYIDSEGIKFDENQNMYISGSANNPQYGSDPIPSCKCGNGSDTLVVEEFNPFIAKFNQNGEGLWIKDIFGDVAMIEVKGEFIYVVGSSSQSSISFGDYTLNLPSFYNQAGYIAKFDTSGVFHWAKHFGVQTWDSHLQILDLKAIDENNIVLVGRSFTQSVPNQVFFQNSSTLNGDPWASDDFFIVNYDSLGNVKWHDITFSSGYEKPMQIASDPERNIYVTGNFSNTLYFADDTLNTFGSDDVMVVAYSITGEELWAKQVGGTGSDQGKGIGIDSNQNIYVLGGTSSTALEFGDLSYELSGSAAQMFLAKLKLSGIGVHELDIANTIKLYPNPNTGTFSVRSEQTLEQLEIYNLLGEMVFAKNFEKPTKQFHIESSLITGIYFVLIKTEEGNYTAQKMIVE